MMFYRHIDENHRAQRPPPRPQSGGVGDRQGGDRVAAAALQQVYRGVDDPAARLFTRRGAGLRNTPRKGRLDGHGPAIALSRQQQRYQCYRQHASIDAIVDNV
ncbi:hypothetical protein [Streptomyces sp. NPDC003247]|uniref:hypothetical protein n=1 Tax=Streptomyces sp. NPDC003247 TaxID=3364677 RepID=UPI00369233C2